MVAAAVFFVIAVGALITPHQMAARLGYRLENVDALSEFRAVYVGVWLATSVLLVVAARHVEWTVLGDLGALLILGQTLGRLLSLLLDGVPTARIWPFFVLELAGGLAILALRPRPTHRGAAAEGRGA